MYGGYRAVFSTIWTEDTGRLWNTLGHQYHKVAFYLLTGPMSNAYGLYYLPLAVASEHTALTAHQLLKVFEAFAEQEFAYYDMAAQWVWVRNMVRFQLFSRDNVVSQSDTRVKGLRKFYATCPPNMHLGPFFDLYDEALELGVRREGKRKLALRPDPTSSSAATSTALALVGVPTKAELFERWWKHYPEKVGKKAALAEWLRIPNVDEAFTAKAIATLEWQRRQPEWVKEDGQFIPDPERYLKRGRWQDEPRDQTGLTDRDARTANVLAEWARGGNIIEGESA